MNKIVIAVLSGTAGIIVGGIAAASYFRKNAPLKSVAIEYKTTDPEPCKEASKFTSFENFRNHIPYAKLAKRSVDISDYSNEVDFKDEEAEKRSNDFSKSIEPYVIPVEEFETDLQKYEHYTLEYFPETGLVKDVEDTIIDDYNRLIGNDALKEFGNNSNDPDVVYIRNEKLGCDYEVNRVIERN